MILLRFDVCSLCALSFSRLESKVQMLESLQRGELEDMREEKNRLQVHTQSQSCGIIGCLSGVVQRCTEFATDETF